MDSVRLFGLIGYPLSHSFSPAWFSEKFRREGIAANYRAFELADLNAFEPLLEEHPELEGLNVTVPYKEQVIRYLDRQEDEAKEVGAVNCIHIKAGELIGYNTDVWGFKQSLLPLLDEHHQRALVLGTGGASKAVCFVLDQLGVEYLVVSREGQGQALRYEDVGVEIIEGHQLIVNTTPLGMYPNIEGVPQIPYGGIGEKHLMYDLIYNPEETLFLQRGKARGARIKNGLEMLKLQAEKSWEIWNG